MKLASFTIAGKPAWGVVQQHQVLDAGSILRPTFPLPRLIEYRSKCTQLEPGHVIVTATPGGAGMQRTPPLWMKPGDTVAIEIDSIGLRRNTLADEA